MEMPRSEVKKELVEFQGRFLVCEQLFSQLLPGEVGHRRAKAEKRLGQMLRWLTGTALWNLALTDVEKELIERVRKGAYFYANAFENGKILGIAAGSGRMPYLGIDPGELSRRVKAMQALDAAVPYKAEKVPCPFEPEV
jgi:hypothetical protein